MTGPVCLMVDIEDATLEDCEDVIERGMTTFVEVGQALLRIRDGRLYRAEHPTFEAYCRDRWGFSDRRARQIIASSEIATSLTGNMLPANARQAAELVGLEPEVAAEVMAIAAEETGGRPTAAAIRDVRDQITTPAPKPTAPIETEEQRSARVHREQLGRDADRLRQLVNGWITFHRLPDRDDRTALLDLLIPEDRAVVLDIAGRLGWIL